MKTKSTLGKTIVAIVLGMFASQTVFAVDLWWDTNGTADGSSGGTTASGAFTAANFWNSDSTGGAGGALSTWDNVAGNVAHFSAGTNATGTSTITANGTLGGLVIEEGRVVMNGTYTLNASPITVDSGAILETNSSIRIATTTGSVITLNNGTLRTTNAGANGSFVDNDSNIVLNGGGTFDYQVLNTLNIITGTTISGTGPLTKTGGGVIALAGTGSWTGGTIINDGELRIRTSTNRLPTTTDVTINSPGILNLNGVGQQIGSLTGNGRVGLAGATLTINGATSTTFSGVIEVTANAGAGGSTATGGALTKTGASTLTLTGNNTYTGTTTINTSGGAISIGDGGTTGSLVSSVNVNNTNATLIFNRSDDSSYGGIVSGTGLVRKEGAGVLTLSNATNEWTNTGSITINGGAIQFGTSAVGFATATPVVVNTSGTLDMNNVNDTFGSLAGAGAVLQGAGNLTLGAASGTTTFSGTITGSGIFRKGSDLPTGATHLSTQILSGNNTLGEVRVNAGSLIFSGTNSTGATTVNGGALSINGSNTVSGAATVAGGSLFVNGTMSAGGTDVSGGVLGGTGSVSGSAVVNSGALAAGVGGANATLSVDTLTLNGGLLQPTLGVPGSPLGSSDFVNVTGSGAFTLNGSTLNIATANGVADGTYRVLKYNGTYVGSFGNLINSTQAGFDSITLIDNTTDGAIDVAIDITERNWVADSSGDWSNGSNWGPNPTQPNGAGAVANFGNTTPTNPSHTVTLDDGDKTVGVVNLTGSSNYAIAASGSNKLILDTWGADAVVNVASGATHSISAAVELKKKTNITVAGAGDTFTISGLISGTGNPGLVKSGQGTLVLNSGVANTYTGGTTVLAGTLVGDSNTIQGAIANTGVVIFNQSFNGAFANVISGTGGSVTKNDAGQLNLTAANTFTGGFNLNGGTVAVDNNAALGLANSAVNIASGTTISTVAATARTLTYAYAVNGDFTLGQSSGGTAAVTMAGTMDLGASARAITVVNSTDTISALISSTGGGINKQGSGILAITAGTNTYTGDTTLTAGKISIDADGKLGSGAGNLNLVGGGLIISANRSVTTDPVLNPLNMSADTEITTTSTANTVNVNFSGPVTATAGTLTFRDDGADAATDVFDPRFSAGGITFGRPIVLASGALGSTVRLSSFNTTGSTQLFTGEISGTGNFRRSASSATTGGVTEFTAANTYSGGTAINDGTLKVNNTSGSGTGTGPVTVGAGAATVFRGTLGGMGSIDGLITVQEGGTIAPGNSIGTLTAAGGLTLQPLSNLNFELGTPGSPYGASDLIDVTNSGGLTINGGTVNLINAGDMGAGTYKLIDYVDTLGGLFSNLSLGLTQPAGFTYMLVDNAGNTSIDLLVTVASVAGDYNLDGKVNAADYVLWRKDPNAFGGDPGGYNTWRANFGDPPGSGSGSSVGNSGSVPEPATLALLLLGALALTCSRVRGRS